MEIRQIKYFVAVIDCGSLSSAARQVHVAQSALSKQMSALEDPPCRGLSLAPQSKVRSVNSVSGDFWKRVMAMTVAPALLASRATALVSFVEPE